MLCLLGIRMYVRLMENVVCIDKTSVIPRSSLSHPWKFETSGWSSRWSTSQEVLLKACYCYASTTRLIQRMDVSQVSSCKHTTSKVRNQTLFGKTQTETRQYTVMQHRSTVVYFEKIEDGTLRAVWGNV